MQIAIIGAGPAGLICAWQLAEQRHEVTVFEKKIDLGAQGSGVLIQPVGLAALESIGVRQQVEALGRKLDCLRGYSNHTRDQQVIAVDYKVLKGEFNYSLGINRSALWSLLFEKVKRAGVQLEIGTRINNLHYRRDAETGCTSVTVVGFDKQEYGCFDLIIDSSGAHSELRHFANTTSKLTTLKFGALYASLKLPKDSAYNQSVMNVYTGPTNRGVGVMPTGISQESGEQTASIFFNVVWRELENKEDNLNWDQASFEKWKSETIKRWPNVAHLLNQITNVEQLYLAKFKQCTIAQPLGNRIVFIGDAAHCSSPQIGQGINMSIVDSVVLAQCIKCADADSINEVIEKYAKERKKHVWFYQSFAKLLMPVYQSGSPLWISIRNFFSSYLIKSTLFLKLSTYLLSGSVAKPLRLLDRSAD